jgi:hypothetical protein
MVGDGMGREREREREREEVDPGCAFPVSSEALYIFPGYFLTGVRGE